jgi:hypothetical protein
MRLRRTKGSSAIRQLLCLEYIAGVQVEAMKVGGYAHGGKNHHMPEVL